MVEEYHPLSQDATFVADKPLSAYQEEEEAFWAEQHVLNDRMNADFRERDKAAAAAGAAAALDAAVRSPRRTS